jgi:hypothetical protein
MLEPKIGNRNRSGPRVGRPGLQVDAERLPFPTLMTQTPETNPNDALESRIERLDRLIETREDGVRGLGVRLALGFAREFREGLAPGSTTAELVAGWVERFGSEVVDEAVSQARVLLKDPARMADEFRKRLEPPGFSGSDSPGMLEDESDA